MPDLRVSWGNSCSSRRGAAFTTPPITRGTINDRGLCHLSGALNSPPRPLSIFQRKKIWIGAVRTDCIEKFSHGVSPGTTKSAQYHPETNGRMPYELSKCQWIKLITHSIYQQLVFLHFLPLFLPCSYGKCPSVQMLILIKTSSFSVLTYLLMSSLLQSRHLCSEFFKAVSNFILSCEVFEDSLFEKGCKKKNRLNWINSSSNILMSHGYKSCSEHRGRTRLWKMTSVLKLPCCFPSETQGFRSCNLLNLGQLHRRYLMRSLWFSSPRKKRNGAGGDE